jgi:hypothetical protein
MDAVSRRRHIVVAGAHDDACVRRYLSVQAGKVTVIKGHRRSTHHRECDDFGVCDALIRLGCRLRGENVVAKLTQAVDRGSTEILISIEPGHRFLFRRLVDGLLNLLLMGGIVVPDDCQIRQR